MPLDRRSGERPGAREEGAVNEQAVARPAARIEVELLYVPGCANVEQARGLLNAVLSELHLAVQLQEREGAYPSPTIRVNGRDVMGAPASSEASCRLDLPTRERLLAALKGAAK
jgi:hypothetical protein